MYSNVLLQRFVLPYYRDYCEGLRDSLDLVPIGAWHGNGRKVGWFSPFLLAAYDPETETYQSVCRCMSGFSDVFYAEVGALILYLLTHTHGHACVNCILEHAHGLQRSKTRALANLSFSSRRCDGYGTSGLMS